MIRATFCVFALAALTLAGCAGAKRLPAEFRNPQQISTDYTIGPGDQLQVFVWRSPEITTSVPVRPDGKISTPLVEDMVAVGKTPSQLARDIESVLATYIRSPVVTVIVTGFVGTFDSRVRVAGQAASPQALPYRDGMTLLDVMIEVGGLTDTAAGNKAKIIRRIGDQQREFGVRIEDLLEDGNIAENVNMLPGDIVIIPESVF